MGNSKGNASNYRVCGNAYEKYHIKAVVNWWIPIPSKLWNEFKLAGKCDESMFDELDWIETSFPTFHPQISDSLKTKLTFCYLR